MQIMNEITIKTLAGRSEEAEELRRQHVQETCLRWDDAKLINNGRMLLQNDRPSSDEHCILKALFIKSLGRKKFLNNNMGNARSLSGTHHDFESTKLHGRLDAKKKIQVENCMQMMKL